MAYSLRRHLQAARLTRQGEHAGAAECYRAMAIDGPGQWELRLMVADCLSQAGRIPEALEEIQKVAEAEPDDFLTLKTAARLFMESGDHARGRHYVERALSAPAPDAPSRFERFFCVLAVATIYAMRLIPRYRRIRQPSLGDLYVEGSWQKWRDWARQYLTWHDAAFPRKAGGGT